MSDDPAAASESSESTAHRMARTTRTTSPRPCGRNASDSADWEMTLLSREERRGCRSSPAEKSPCGGGEGLRMWRREGWSGCGCCGGDWIQR